MMRGEDHSWCADAALGAAAVQKALLQCLQVAVRSKTFDRDDFRTLRLKNGNEAAIHQHSVYQHRAGAALALATAFFRSRQSKFVTQHVEQALHRVDLHGFGLPVHGDGDFPFCSSLWGFRHSFPRADVAALSGAALSESAAKISSGSKGIAWNGTCSASSTALTIAGAGPSMGSSPMPFAPYAPWMFPSSSKYTRMEGKSAEVGMM